MYSTNSLGQNSSAVADLLKKQAKAKWLGDIVHVMLLVIAAGQSSSVLGAVTN